jgi:hypothetical protein
MAVLVVTHPIQSAHDTQYDARLRSPPNFCTILAVFAMFSVVVVLIVLGNTVMIAAQPQDVPVWTNITGCLAYVEFYTVVGCHAGDHLTIIGKNFLNIERSLITIGHYENYCTVDKIFNNTHLQCRLPNVGRERSVSYLSLEIQFEYQNQWYGENVYAWITYFPWDVPYISEVSLPGCGGEFLPSPNNKCPLMFGGGAVTIRGGWFDNPPLSPSVILTLEESKYSEPETYVLQPRDKYQTNSTLRYWFPPLSCNATRLIVTLHVVQIVTRYYDSYTIEYPIMPLNAQCAPPPPPPPRTSSSDSQGVNSFIIISVVCAVTLLLVCIILSVCRVRRDCCFKQREVVGIEQELMSESGKGSDFISMPV